VLNVAVVVKDTDLQKKRKREFDIYILYLSYRWKKLCKLYNQGVANEMTNQSSDSHYFNDETVEKSLKLLE